MSPQELLYYRARARGERHRSAGARTEAAAEIHLGLAVLYERLIDLELAGSSAPPVDRTEAFGCHFK